MSGEDDNNNKGKSPYAKKHKMPFRYSEAYETWRNTGDSRAHDREFLSPSRNDQRPHGGKRDGSRYNNP